MFKGIGQTDALVTIHSHRSSKVVSRQDKYYSLAPAKCVVPNADVKDAQ